MNVALPTYWERFVDGLVQSGRYGNRSEVIRAALRSFEERRTEDDFADYPPGSLAHLYTPAANRAERQLLRGATLEVPQRGTSDGGGPSRWAAVRYSRNCS